MALTRRTALALSGAVAGTVVAASLAGALVLGGDDAADPTPPDPIAVVDGSEVDATTPTTAPAVEIVYQDVYDLPPATAPAGSTGVAGPSPAPAAPVASGDLSSAATATSDDGWDDDEHEDEWEDDEYEDDDEYEYEDDHEYEDDDDDEGEWEDD